MLSTGFARQSKNSLSTLHPWQVMSCFSQLHALICPQQNPISFLLRTAQIYPNKVAIVHKDVKHPVTYTYAVWRVLMSLVSTSNMLKTLQGTAGPELGLCSYRSRYTARRSCCRCHAKLVSFVCGIVENPSSLSHTVRSI